MQDAKSLSLYHGPTHYHLITEVIRWVTGEPSALSYAASLELTANILSSDHQSVKQC